MTNRKETYHGQMSDTEWNKLEEIAKTLGYSSRSEYLNACAYLTVYGKLLPEYSRINTPAKTEIKKFRRLYDLIQTQQKTFFAILSEKNMLPIISRRDTKTIINSLKDDLKKEMLKRCGMIPELSQMEKWAEIYKEIKGADLLEFRIKTANTEVCL